MAKEKKIIRTWIPSRKKGKRGHFSHCREGHPYAGEGPCLPCRAARDAARHASEAVKEKDAKRKRDARWNASSVMMKTEILNVEAEIYVDLWRGMVRLRSKFEQFTLLPMDTMRLCLVLREHIELKPPSKLPAGLRKFQEKEGKNEPLRLQPRD